MQTLICLVLFYGSELVFHFMRQITDKHVVKCKLVDRFFPLIQYSCQLTTYYNMYGMAIRVFEFSSGGIRLERFLPKNQPKEGNY